MDSNEIISKIKTMPGMNAIFVHGMKSGSKLQNVFYPEAVRWMSENGLIEAVVREDATPPAFLCATRKFTVIMLNSLGLDVVKKIQGN